MVTPRQQPLTVYCWTIGLLLSLDMGSWPTISRCPDELVKVLFQVFLFFAVMLFYIVCALSRILRHPWDGGIIYSYYVNTFHVIKN